MHPTHDSLGQIRDAVLDTSYISMGSRRTDSVHEFYRYPARFTPRFAKAAISAFTNPGELVLDPFTGGGTTAVESRLLARDFVGADLNTLAVFVTRSKVGLHTKATVTSVEDWARSVPARVRLNHRVELNGFWQENGYLRNIGTAETWRLRNAVAIALGTLEELPPGPGRILARCAILRTAQWALDATRHAPSVEDFRSVLSSTASAMSGAASQFTGLVSAANEELGRIAKNDVIHEGVPGLSETTAVQRSAAPRLILTSPPYPGVYVLYHRWKIGGRRESPAPFWIANSLDGHGQTYYTMAARNDPQRNGYFERLRMAFTDLARIADPNTWFVQLVGFNSADQMPRYLKTMADLGLEEHRFPAMATEPDGRLWRTVPGRRWWVSSSSLRDVAPQTSREVVLFHQLKRQ